MRMDLAIWLVLEYPKPCSINFIVAQSLDFSVLMLFFLSSVRFSLRIEFLLFFTDKNMSETCFEYFL